MREFEFNTQIVNRSQAGELIEAYRKRGTPIDVQYTEHTAVICIRSNEMPHPRTPYSLVNRRIKFT